MSAIRNALYLVSLTLLVSHSASAEVMDKEPSVITLWTWALVVGGISHVLCKRYTWLTLFVLPLGALVPLSAVLEGSDRTVGPAILQEAGASYSVHASLSLTVVLLLIITGAARGGLRPWFLGAEIAGVYRPTHDEPHTPNDENSKHRKNGA